MTSVHPNAAPVPSITSPGVADYPTLTVRPTANAGDSSIRSISPESPKPLSWGSWLVQTFIIKPLNALKWLLFAILYGITCGHINLNNDTAGADTTPAVASGETGNPATACTTPPGSLQPIVLSTPEQRQTITQEHLQTLTADETRYRESITGGTPLSDQEISDMGNRGLQRSEYILTQNQAGVQTDPVLQERILSFTDRIAELANRAP